MGSISGGGARARRSHRRLAPAVALTLAVIGVAGACQGTDGAGPAPAATGPATTIKGEEHCPAVPDAPSDEAIEAIHAFDGADGANPWGSLIAWDGELYGRTRVGGAAGNGVVFAVGPDGSGYRVLRSFTAGADNGEGNQPHHDSMSVVDDLLFSNTLLGGAGDRGVLFAMGPLTGEERVIHQFAGSPTDGAHAHSSFQVGPEAMWILTAGGGAAGKGTLVRLDRTTGATEVVHSFEPATGDEPHGRVLATSSGRLHGMTRMGGSAGDGVIFAFEPADGTYHVLHEFGPGPANGVQPDHGNLTEDPRTGRLWGLTTFGGAHDRGVVFSIASDGQGFQVHHSFGAGDDGALPHGSLTLVGDHLYGLSFEGGRHGVGTAFRIGTDGLGYEVVAAFDGARTGAFPYDNLVPGPDPGALYGMTGNGGANDPTCARALGTVFRLALPAPRP